MDRAALYVEILKNAEYTKEIMEVSKKVHSNVIKEVPWFDTAVTPNGNFVASTCLLGLGDLFLEVTGYDDDGFPLLTIRVPMFKIVTTKGEVLEYQQANEPCYEWVDLSAARKPIHSKVVMEAPTGEKVTRYPAGNVIHIKCVDTDDIEFFPYGIAMCHKWAGVMTEKLGIKYHMRDFDYDFTKHASRNMIDSLTELRSRAITWKAPT